MDLMYGVEQPAETVDGDEYTKEILISLKSEWSGKFFQATHLSKQPMLPPHETLLFTRHCMVAFQAMFKHIMCSKITMAF